MLDFDKFTGKPKPNPEYTQIVESGFTGHVYYDGVRIGFLATHGNGKEYNAYSGDSGSMVLSFKSIQVALLDLYDRAFNTSIYANDVITNYVITRVSSITLLVTPNPNVKPRIKCRIHYTYRESTNMVVCEFDKDSKKFIITDKMPSNFIEFENADRIANQIIQHAKIAVGETFA